jgi:hypothetical protein
MGCNCVFMHDCPYTTDHRACQYFNLSSSAETPASDKERTSSPVVMGTGSIRVATDLALRFIVGQAHKE